MGTFNKTKAGESERDKAVNLLETESFKEAVKCYEEAITMRKGLVRSAAQAGENSHIYDVVNARLGASYLLYRKDRHRYSLELKKPARRRA